MALRRTKRAACFASERGFVGTKAPAAAYYPTVSRATGVSWANGVGRIGSVLGSMLGGVLLSLEWALHMVFAIVAIPAFACPRARQGRGTGAGQQREFDETRRFVARLSIMKCGP